MNENNLTWDLSKLFASDQEYDHEIKNIDTLLEKASKYKTSTFDANTLFEVLNLKSQVKELASNALIYASLKYYEDVESSSAIKMKKKAEEMMNTVDTMLAFVDAKVVELGKDKINNYLTINKELNVYKHHLHNIFRLRSHIMDDQVNLQIKQLKDEISTAITNYHDLRKDLDLGIIMVNEDKVRLTPANSREYLSSTDREIRKQAFLSINNAYKGEQNNFARLLNKIYQNRVKISELEAYSSVREQALFTENIDPTIVSNLINVVPNHLDSFQKYLELKATALGIKNPHLYDYNVGFSNVFKKYQINDAKDIIRKAFMPLGEEYVKMIDSFFDNNHIDAKLDRKKHQTMIFCWSVYVFINYKETYFDLKSLAHELGHVLNHYLSKEVQPFIYDDSTVFIGEIPALIHELLLNRYLSEHAQTDVEQLFYLSKNIENYFTKVYEQTMCTELEDILYTHAQNNTELTADLIESEYLKLLKKYYGKNTTYDDCAGAGWTRIDKLFRWCFYSYKYATGLIAASAIINKLIDEKSLPLKKYFEFLAAGSNDYSLELLKKLGIDMLDPDLMSDSFAILENDLEKITSILQKER